ncbi:MAG TPA: DUF2971 domain-containing protein [Methanosarcina sp.]|nr:DUF2971 domain-containing protein [Methanosarcina sp.]
MSKEIIDNKLFYKYQSIDEHFFENLSNNQLFFCDPTEFDAPVNYTTTLCRKGTEEEWIAYYMANRWEKDRIEKKIEENLKNGKSVKQGEEIVSYLDTNSGILPRMCCLSTRNDSALMWSHYANNHTGVCLCFKPTKSLCADSRSGEINEIYRLTFGTELAELMEVKYKDGCPGEVNILNMDRIKVGEQILECFLTKDSEWEYEKEYRMLSFKKYFHGEYVKKYEKNELEGIIFGLKIKRSDAQEIYDRVYEQYINEKKKVKFYRVKCIKDKYAMEIERIEDKDTKKYLESLQ